MKQSDPSERTGAQKAQTNEKQLEDLLSRLHLAVGLKLEEKLESEDCETADIRAVLVLLKQNNVMVTVSPDAVDHTDQLDEARRAAERQRKPFGNRSVAKAKQEARAERAAKKKAERDAEETKKEA